MMKKSIFTLFFLAVIGYVSAQTLQFELGGEVLADGQTVYCTNFNPDFGEYAQEMYIRNISSNDLNIVIEREIINVPEGGITYFCWGMCFSPSVDVSPAVTMSAGAVSGPSDLSFHFMPASTTDVAFVKYYAYDERNAEERISVLIAYNTTESISETPIASLGHAYPNPASSVVRFNYELSPSNNVSVSIYNLLGQEMKSQHLNGFQGQVSFSVAEFNEGIYFCNLIVNGQAVKTEKFVVKK